MIFTDTMHERKQIIYDRSEFFVILPGGFGTLDECFEVITWNQLGYLKKPVYFLNFDGFFDHLKSFVGKLESENFIKTYYTFTPHFYESIDELIHKAEF